MSNYAKSVSTRVRQNAPTSQNQPIPGSSQVANSGGGYCWNTSEENTLDRFLILGSESNTYYASAETLTKKNFENIKVLISKNGRKVVDRAVEISVAGRAPSNNHAIFVLALCSTYGDNDTKRYAMSKLSDVCRTGTHLFTFVGEINDLRGWGRIVRNGVANWYLKADPEKLAYQVVKYRNRNGWTHKDVLRMCHPKTTEAQIQSIFKFICKDTPAEIAIIKDFLKAQNCKEEAEIVELIKHSNLPWECLPTNFLPLPSVWTALIPKLPYEAMIRNLGRMSANGTITKVKDNGVCDKITNDDSIKKSRIHPLAILNALRTYEQGHGEKGKLSWNVNSDVVTALNKAFFKSFGNVTSTEKKIALCLDVSGSMGLNNINRMSMTPREAVAALSLVTYRREPNAKVFAFSHNLTPVSFGEKYNVNDAMDRIGKIPMGATDCSLPMVHALKNNLFFDTFVIYTDNETNYGKIHPSQALKEYRKKVNPKAKMVVVAMTATNFTIADPNDNGMLDIVGFDLASPQLISDFTTN